MAQPARTRSKRKAKAAPNSERKAKTPATGSASPTLTNTQLKQGLHDAIKNWDKPGIAKYGKALGERGPEAMDGVYWWDWTPAVVSMVCDTHDEWEKFFDILIWCRETEESALSRLDFGMSFDWEPMLRKCIGTRPYMERLEAAMHNSICSRRGPKAIRALLPLATDPLFGTFVCGVLKSATSCSQLVQLAGPGVDIPKEALAFERDMSSGDIKDAVRAVIASGVDPRTVADANSELVAAFTSVLGDIDS